MSFHLSNHWSLVTLCFIPGVNFHSFRCFCIVTGVHLLLPWMPLCPTRYTTKFAVVIVSLPVFHCHSLMWFHISSGVLLTRVAYIIPGVPLLLTWVAPHCLMCPMADHLGDSTSSQMSHFFLLGWFYIISDVSLLLTVVNLCHFRCSFLNHLDGSSLALNWVALHCSRCSIFTNWDGLVFNCLFFQLALIISDVLLPLSGVVLHHSWCFYSTH